MSRAILNNTGGGYNSDECTATSADLLEGKTAIVKDGNEPVKGIIPCKKAELYIPGKSDIIIPSGQYLSEDQIISGDPNLIPKNIKKGQTVFGITGTHDGWVPGPMEVYDRGTFGDGYDSDFLRKVPYYSEHAFNAYSIAYTDTCIAYNVYKDSGGSAGKPGFATALTNFALYNTVNVIYSVTRLVSNATDRLALYQGLTNYLCGFDSFIASTTNRPTSINTEYTLSLNISNVNFMGSIGFSVDGVSGYYVNVHKIYFT